MAFTVYLNGGPCNGTTKRLTNAQFKSQQTTCKGADYVYNSTQIIPGHRYVFDVLVPEGSGGGGAGVPGSAHAVKAWTDVRTTVNRRLPTTLRTIDKLNAGSLTKLAHRGRVKH